MIDMRLVREDVAAFSKAMHARGLDGSALAERLVVLDDDRRSTISRLQEAQARRNALVQEISEALREKDADRAFALRQAANELKSEIAGLEREQSVAEADFRREAERVPNVPAPDVPAGGEDENIVLREEGADRTVGRLARVPEHYVTGERLGLMDFEVAARLSGSRFCVLRGGLARLERALGQFMIDLHVREHGYEEVAAPLLVRDDALFGTGQLPKFADDLFRVTSEPTLHLIPTAEVTLTNLVRESILREDELPLRLTALTPCFRAEAGSAGRDVVGMMRQHQFMKCELVSITTPEAAAHEHERMLVCAEKVLQSLDLKYRVVLLASGDMGFAARKTYDIEVWLPGQGRYREISSVSDCGDFQARRMNARFKREGKNHFVTTLNGSGVAVGRALIAIMETYVSGDGSVTVPDALLPYMGGITTIEKKAP